MSRRLRISLTILLLCRPFALKLGELLLQLSNLGVKRRDALLPLGTNVAIVYKRRLFLFRATRSRPSYPRS